MNLRPRCGPENTAVFLIAAMLISALINFTPCRAALHHSNKESARIIGSLANWFDIFRSERRPTQPREVTHKRSAEPKLHGYAATNLKSTIQQHTDELQVNSKQRIHPDFRENTKEEENSSQRVQSRTRQGPRRKSYEVNRHERDSKNSTNRRFHSFHTFSRVKQNKKPKFKQIARKKTQGAGRRFLKPFGKTTTSTGTLNRELLDYISSTKTEFLESVNRVDATDPCQKSKDLENGDRLLRSAASSAKSIWTNTEGDFLFLQRLNTPSVENDKERKRKSFAWFSPKRTTHYSQNDNFLFLDHRPTANPRFFGKKDKPAGSKLNRFYARNSTNINSIEGGATPLRNSSSTNNGRKVPDSEADKNKKVQTLLVERTSDLKKQPSYTMPEKGASSSFSGRFQPFINSSRKVDGKGLTVKVWNPENQSQPSQKLRDSINFPNLDRKDNDGKENEIIISTEPTCPPGCPFKHMSDENTKSNPERHLKNVDIGLGHANTDFMPNPKGWQEEPRQIPNFPEYTKLEGMEPGRIPGQHFKGRKIGQIPDPVQLSPLLLGQSTLRLNKICGTTESGYGGRHDPRFQKSKKGIHPDDFEDDAVFGDARTVESRTFVNNLETVPLPEIGGSGWFRMAKDGSGPEFLRIAPGDRYFATELQPEAVTISQSRTEKFNHGPSQFRLGEPPSNSAGSNYCNPPTVRFPPGSSACTRRFFARGTPNNNVSNKNGRLEYRVNQGDPTPVDNNTAIKGNLGRDEGFGDVKFVVMPNLRFRNPSSQPCLGQRTNEHRMNETPAFFINKHEAGPIGFDKMRQQQNQERTPKQGFFCESPRSPELDVKRNQPVRDSSSRPKYSGNRLNKVFDNCTQQTPGQYYQAARATKDGSKFHDPHELLADEFAKINSRHLLSSDTELQYNDQPDMPYIFEPGEDVSMLSSKNHRKIISKVRQSGAGPQPSPPNLPMVNQVLSSDTSAKEAPTNDQSRFFLNDNLKCQFLRGNLPAATIEEFDEQMKRANEYSYIKRIDMVKGNKKSIVYKIVLINNTVPKTPKKKWHKTPDKSSAQGNKNQRVAYSPQSAMVNKVRSSATCPRKIFIIENDLVGKQLQGKIPKILKLRGVKDGTCACALNIGDADESRMASVDLLTQPWAVNNYNQSFSSNFASPVYVTQSGQVFQTGNFSYMFTTPEANAQHAFQQPVDFGQGQTSSAGDSFQNVQLGPNAIGKNPTTCPEMVVCLLQSTPKPLKEQMKESIMRFYPGRQKNIEVLNCKTEVLPTLKAPVHPTPQTVFQTTLPQSFTPREYITTPVITTETLNTAPQRPVYVTPTTQSSTAIYKPPSTHHLPPIIPTSGGPQNFKSTPPGYVNMTNNTPFQTPGPSATTVSSSYTNQQQSKVQSEIPKILGQNKMASVFQRGKSISHEANSAKYSNGGNLNFAHPVNDAQKGQIESRGAQVREEIIRPIQSYPGTPMDNTPFRNQRSFETNENYDEMVKFWETNLAAGKKGQIEDLSFSNYFPSELRSDGEKAESFQAESLSSLTNEEKQNEGMKQENGQNPSHESVTNRNEVPDKNPEKGEQKDAGGRHDIYSTVIASNIHSIDESNVKKVDLRPESSTEKQSIDVVQSNATFLTETLTIKPATCGSEANMITRAPTQATDKLEKNQAHEVIEQVDKNPTNIGPKISTEYQSIPMERKLEATEQPANNDVTRKEQRILLSREDPSGATEVCQTSLGGKGDGSETYLSSAHIITAKDETTDSKDNTKFAWTNQAVASTNPLVTHSTIELLTPTKTPNTISYAPMSSEGLTSTAMSLYTHQVKLQTIMPSVKTSTALNDFLSVDHPGTAHININYKTEQNIRPMVEENTTVMTSSTGAEKIAKEFSQISKDSATRKMSEVENRPLNGNENIVSTILKDRQQEIETTESTQQNTSNHFERQINSMMGVLDQLLGNISYFNRHLQVNTPDSNSADPINETTTLPPITVDFLNSSTHQQMTRLGSNTYQKVVSTIPETLIRNVNNNTSALGVVTTHLGKLGPINNDKNAQARTQLENSNWPYATNTSALRFLPYQAQQRDIYSEVFRKGLGFSVLPPTKTIDQPGIRIGQQPPFQIKTSPARTDQYPGMPFTAPSEKFQRNFLSVPISVQKTNTPVGTQTQKPNILSYSNYNKGGQLHARTSFFVIEEPIAPTIETKIENYGDRSPPSSAYNPIKVGYAQFRKRLNQSLNDDWRRRSKRLKSNEAAQRKFLLDVLKNSSMTLKEFQDNIQKLNHDVQRQRQLLLNLKATQERKLRSKFPMLSGDQLNKLLDTILKKSESISTDSLTQPELDNLLMGNFQDTCFSPSMQAIQSYTSSQDSDSLNSNWDFEPIWESKIVESSGQRPYPVFIKPVFSKTITPMQQPEYLPDERAHLNNYREEYQTIQRAQNSKVGKGEDMPQENTRPQPHILLQVNQDYEGSLQSPYLHVSGNSNPGRIMEFEEAQNVLHQINEKNENMRPIIMNATGSDQTQSAAAGPQNYSVNNLRGFRRLMSTGRSLYDQSVDTEEKNESRRTDIIREERDYGKLPHSKTVNYYFPSRSQNTLGKEHGQQLAIENDCNVHRGDQRFKEKCVSKGDQKTNVKCGLLKVNGSLPAQIFIPAFILHNFPGTTNPQIMTVQKNASLEVNGLLNSDKTVPNGLYIFRPDENTLLGTRDDLDSYSHFLEARNRSCTCSQLSVETGSSSHQTGTTNMSRNFSRLQYQPKDNQENYSKQIPQGNIINSKEINKVKYKLFPGRDQFRPFDTIKRVRPSLTQQDVADAHFKSHFILLPPRKQSDQESMPSVEQLEIVQAIRNDHQSLSKLSTSPQQFASQEKGTPPAVNINFERLVTSEESDRGYKNPLQWKSKISPQRSSLDFTNAAPNIPADASATKDTALTHPNGTCKPPEKVASLTCEENLPAHDSVSSASGLPQSTLVSFDPSTQQTLLNVVSNRSSENESELPVVYDGFEQPSGQNKTYQVLKNQPPLQPKIQLTSFQVLPFINQAIIYQMSINQPCCEHVSRDPIQAQTKGKVISREKGDILTNFSDTYEPPDSKSSHYAEYMIHQTQSDASNSRQPESMEEESSKRQRGVYFTFTPNGMTENANGGSVYNGSIQAIANISIAGLPLNTDLQPMSYKPLSTPEPLKSSTESERLQPPIQQNEAQLSRDKESLFPIQAFINQAIIYQISVNQSSCNPQNPEQIQAHHTGVNQPIKGQSGDFLSTLSSASRTPISEYIKYPHLMTQQLRLYEPAFERLVTPHTDYNQEPLSMGLSIAANERIPKIMLRSFYNGSIQAFANVSIDNFPLPDTVQRMSDPLPSLIPLNSVIDSSSESEPVQSLAHQVMNQASMPQKIDNLRMNYPQQRNQDQASASPILPFINQVLINHMPINLQFCGTILQDQIPVDRKQGDLPPNEPLECNVTDFSAAYKKPISKSLRHPGHIKPQTLFTSRKFKRLSLTETSSDSQHEVVLPTSPARERMIIISPANYVNGSIQAFANISVEMCPVDQSQHNKLLLLPKRMSPNTVVDRLIPYQIIKEERMRQLKDRLLTYQPMLQVINQPTDLPNVPPFNQQEDNRILSNQRQTYGTFSTHPRLMSQPPIGQPVNDQMSGFLTAASATDEQAAQNILRPPEIRNSQILRLDPKIHRYVPLEVVHDQRPPKGITSVSSNNFVPINLSENLNDGSTQAFANFSVGVCLLTDQPQTNQLTTYNTLTNTITYDPMVDHSSPGESDRCFESQITQQPANSPKTKEIPMNQRAARLPYQPVSYPILPFINQAVIYQLSIGSPPCEQLVKDTSQKEEKAATTKADGILKISSQTYVAPNSGIFQQSNINCTETRPNENILEGLMPPDSYLQPTTIPLVSTPNGVASGFSWENVNTENILPFTSSSFRESLLTYQLPNDKLIPFEYLQTEETPSSQEKLSLVIEPNRQLGGQLIDQPSNQNMMQLPTKKPLFWLQGQAFSNRRSVRHLVDQVSTNEPSPCQNQPRSFPIIPFINQAIIYQMSISQPLCEPANVNPVQMNKTSMTQLISRDPRYTSPASAHTLRDSKQVQQAERAVPETRIDQQPIPPQIASNEQKPAVHYLSESKVAVSGFPSEQLYREGIQISSNNAYRNSRFVGKPLQNRANFFSPLRIQAPLNLVFDRESENVTCPPLGNYTTDRDPVRPKLNPISRNELPSPAQEQPSAFPITAFINQAVIYNLSIDQHTCKTVLSELNQKSKDNQSPYGSATPVSNSGHYSNSVTSQRRLDEPHAQRLVPPKIDFTSQETGIPPPPLQLYEAAPVSLSQNFYNASFQATANVSMQDCLVASKPPQNKLMLFDPSTQTTLNSMLDGSLPNESWSEQTMKKLSIPENTAQLPICQPNSQFQDEPSAFPVVTFINQAIIYQISINQPQCNPPLSGQTQMYPPALSHPVNKKGREMLPPFIPAYESPISKYLQPHQFSIFQMQPNDSEPQELIPPKISWQQELSTNYSSVPTNEKTPLKDLYNGSIQAFANVRFQECLPTNQFQQEESVTCNSANTPPNSVTNITQTSASGVKLGDQSLDQPSVPQNVDPLSTNASLSHFEYSQSPMSILPFVNQAIIYKLSINKSICNPLQQDDAVMDKAIFNSTDEDRKENKVPNRSTEYFQHNELTGQALLNEPKAQRRYSMEKMLDEEPPVVSFNFSRNGVKLVFSMDTFPNQTTVPPAPPEPPAPPDPPNTSVAPTLPDDTIILLKSTSQYEPGTRIRPPTAITTTIPYWLNYKSLPENLFTEASTQSGEHLKSNGQTIASSPRPSLLSEQTQPSLKPSSLLFAKQQNYPQEILDPRTIQRELEAGNAIMRKNLERVGFEMSKNSYKNNTFSDWHFNRAIYTPNYIRTQPNKNPDPRYYTPMRTFQNSPSPLGRFSHLEKYSYVSPRNDLAPKREDRNFISAINEASQNILSQEQKEMVEKHMPADLSNFSTNLDRRNLDARSPWGPQSQLVGTSDGDESTAERFKLCSGGHLAEAMDYVSPDRNGSTIASMSFQENQQRPGDNVHLLEFEARNHGTLENLISNGSIDAPVVTTSGGQDVDSKESLWGGSQKRVAKNLQFLTPESRNQNMRGEWIGREQSPAPVAQVTEKQDPIGEFLRKIRRLRKHFLLSTKNFPSVKKKSYQAKTSWPSLKKPTMAQSRNVP